MVRSFANEFEKMMRRLERRDVPLPRPPALTFDGTIMTGTLFAPVLSGMIDQLNDRFGTRLHVLPVENDYFGGDVSVAGLLTGGDFAAVRDQVRGEFAVMPRVALKSDEPILLDGMRFEDLQETFRVPLFAFDFESLAKVIETGVADGGSDFSKAA